MTASSIPHIAENMIHLNGGTQAALETAERMSKSCVTNKYQKLFSDVATHIRGMIAAPGLVFTVVRYIGHVDGRPLWEVQEVESVSLKDGPRTYRRMVREHNLAHSDNAEIRVSRSLSGKARAVSLYSRRAISPIFAANNFECARLAIRDALIARPGTRRDNWARGYTADKCREWLAQARRTREAMSPSFGFKALGGF